MPDICVKIPNPFYIALNNKRMSECWQILMSSSTQALFTRLPCIDESGKPYFFFKYYITRSLGASNPYMSLESPLASTTDNFIHLHTHTADVSIIDSICYRKIKTFV